MSFWQDPSAWFGREDLWILYLAMAVAAFLKYTVPIVPGDMALLASVFFVGAKGGSSLLCVAVITAGGTPGALVAYWWGGRFGEILLRRPRLGPLTLRVERLLGRWGYWPLLLNRFVLYVRPILFPAAGMLKMKPWPVAASALGGNLLFGSFLVLLGHTAGREWAKFSSLYHYYQIWLGLAVFAFLSVSVLYLVVGAWKGRER